MIKTVNSTECRSMNITRRAKDGDIGQIVRLNLIVQELHSNIYPDIFKKEVNTGELSDLYLELIADENQYIFVTELDEGIAGYCWAEFSLKNESPTTHGISKLYIHQMCVDEKFRGKGLGKTLVNEIKNLASNLNVNHIGVDSWSFNSTAVNFFRSQGFTPYNEKMWLK